MELSLSLTKTLIQMNSVLSFLFGTKPRVTIGLSGKKHYHGLGICGRCGKPANHSCPIDLIPFSENSGENLTLAAAPRTSTSSAINPQDNKQQNK